MVDKTKIFKNIYDEYTDAIFRFCLVRTSNKEQALDITQETFLRLWNSLQEEEIIKNPRAFLFTISRRLIIDWYRKKKSLSLDSMIEAEIPYDIKDENSGNIEIEAEGRLLLEKIKNLSETHREPIYLRFVEDLSINEIGKILEISPNAVSVRINRGLEELRKMTGYNNN